MSAGPFATGFLVALEAFEVATLLVLVSLVVSDDVLDELELSAESSPEVLNWSEAVMTVEGETSTFFTVTTLPSSAVTVRNMSAIFYIVRIRVTYCEYQRLNRHQMSFRSSYNLVEL